MKKKIQRLSNDELRRSRAGTLGRFPPPEIYEPETSETTDGGLEVPNALARDYRLTDADAYQKR